MPKQEVTVYKCEMCAAERTQRTLPDGWDEITKPNPPHIKGMECYVIFCGDCYQFLCQEILRRLGR